MVQRTSKDRGNVAAERSLERFLRADPKELAEFFQRTQRQIADHKREVDERRERLRAAVGGPNKQFRL